MLAYDLQKSQKMRLTKIIEFRIIAMADHYDQKCHVLILLKIKYLKKRLYTTRIDNHLSIENGFSTHVSTHLSRRPGLLSIAYFCVIKICWFTEVGEVLYTKFFFSPGVNFYVLITG